MKRRGRPGKYDSPTRRVTVTLTENMLASLGRRNRSEALMQVWREWSVLREMADSQGVDVESLLEGR